MGKFNKFVVGTLRFFGFKSSDTFNLDEFKGNVYDKVDRKKSQLEAKARLNSKK